MRRIGYAKIGRSIGLDEDKFGFQGDAEAPNLLRRLALEYPDVEFVLIGRNSGGTLGLSNVTNPWDDELQGVTYSNCDDPAKCPPGWEYQSYQKGTGTGWRVNPEALKRDARIVEKFRDLHGCIVHLGNHGCSHIPIPPANITWDEIAQGKDHLTQPQLWSRNYGTYLDEGLNLLGDVSDGKAPVIWLCADPRNFMKTRSIKWPTGLDDILAQYAFTRTSKHERFRDPRSPRELGFSDFCSTDRRGEVWISRDRYTHADLEMMILPDDWQSWGDVGFEHRIPFGVATTSFNVGSPRRSELVRDWLLANFPEAEVWGKWDPKSLSDIEGGDEKVWLNDPRDFKKLLERFRVTVALPALGSGWTAAKPYQCFAAGCVCFYIGGLDDQGWTLPTKRYVTQTAKVADGLYSSRTDWTPSDLYLASYLRVSSPAEFKQKAMELQADQSKWARIADMQRELLARRWNQNSLVKQIGHKLGVR